MTSPVVTVGAPAHGGHCVARLEGRVVFVRHALPGERVRLAMTEGGDEARFWRADAAEVIEASPDRVPSPWPEAGPGGVGGGELAHVSLPGQRAWKLAVLREAFERFARSEFPGEVHPAHAHETGLGYRTRVTAVAGADGAATMRVHRSFEARRLSAMPLAVPEVERTLLEARLPEGTRFTVAAASAADAAAAHVVPEGERGPVLRQAVTSVAGTIAHQVRAAGFWQVHTHAPALLVNEVLARVGDAATVWDLYAGAGLFGAALAAQGREVTLVEFDRRAVADARATLAAHGLRAAVHAADVRRCLSTGTLAGTPDAVVLDPPRSGAGAATLTALAAHRPRRIVYVACDPVALARDTALLNQAGWMLDEAQAFDVFPMTHHVEAVASFTLR